MRMPAAILDIDVTRMFPDPDDLRGHGAAHVLFRLHGRPLAWTSAPVQGSRLERDALIRTLLEQHAWGCALPLAERALAGGAPPRCLDVAGLLQQPPPRPPGGPLVTVAICNRAPADVLRHCLEAVQASDYPYIDLLVIDASGDARRVEALLHARAPRARYVREPDWRRTMRRATAECRGDILAITEGDAAPDRRWVSAFVHVFLSDPDVMVATGPALPHSTDRPFNDLARSNGVCRRWWRLQGDVPAAYQTRRGANLAWWRPALDPDRAHDRRAGFTVVYEPAAIVRTPAAQPADVLAAPSTRTPALECAVDLADPIRPIDSGGHDALLLRVSWEGRPLGVARTAGGGVVSPLQMTDAIAQQLTAAVLDSGLGVGEPVCRALLTADLARFVVARHGGSLQWMHDGTPDSAVA